jgi:hypothetical protein
MTRLACFFVLALALVMGPRGASAADDAEALIQKALKLRQAGDDQAARPDLRRAYEISGTPRAAAQLGMCEHALGRWAEADAHLTEALRASKDPWVAKNRAVLEGSLAVVRKFVARVEIAGAPVGAEVLINGHLAGKLPLEDAVVVNAGRVDVELRAPGHRSGNTTIEVAAGHTKSIVLRLAPSLRGAPQVAPANPRQNRQEEGQEKDGRVVGSVAPARPGAGEQGARREDSSASESPAGVDLRQQAGPPAAEAGADTSTPVYRRAWFWTLVAAGVMAVAGGIVWAVAGRETRYPHADGVGVFDNPGR